MKTPELKPLGWALLRRAALPATLAAAASAAVAGWRARTEGFEAARPINDITHSIWPGEAERATGTSARHTLLGLAIHTAASLFWAVGFAALCAPRERAAPERDAAAAAAIAATAWCVDYHVVPKRLTPGFEAHLSGRSLAFVYAALALGLFAGSRMGTARAEDAGSAPRRVK